MNRRIEKLLELDIERSVLFKKVFTLGEINETKAIEYSYLVVEFNKLFLEMWGNINKYKDVTIIASDQNLIIEEANSIYLKHLILR